MKKILKLSETLYVDLLSGYCRRTEAPLPDQPSVRITGSQLKILNCLLERKGNVCPLSMLEGLVDSELGEFSSPGIKQQLNRMKNKLREVDAGFDKETGKQVFKSVSGVGYVFNLPKQGEIIEVKTPADGMIEIDMKFLKNQRLSSQEEIENLKNIFYSITGDKKIIMQAVCNGLHVSNADYQKSLRELSSYVFEREVPAGPVCLMADGGTGKSTMLCDLAVQTAVKYPNWNVYFMDMENTGCEEDVFRQMVEYMYQNGISRIRKTLLCIDSPWMNSEGFRKLYQILMEKVDPYLYIVIGERTSFMLNLLESDYVYRENSYIRAFLIDNLGKENNTDGYFRDSSVQFADVKQCPFPKRLKMDISDRMIQQLSKKEKLDEEVVELCCLDLIYDVNSVTDVFLDFKQRYNYMSKQEEIVKDRYIPQIVMDWDEWKMKCRPLDADCTRLMISEAFPYVAVCYDYGIPFTFAFIRQMTGYPYKSELFKLFPQGLGENIQFVDGSFQFRNDMIAQNYFSCHKEMKPQSCLEELIDEEYMDEETILCFVMSVFSVTKCANPKLRPYLLDYKRLLKLFKINERCMEIVRKHNYEALLELARITLYYGPDLEDERKGRIQKEFSKSFLRVIDGIQEDRIKLEYWGQFFETAVRYCKDIPESLLDFILEVNLNTSCNMIALMEAVYHENIFSMEDGWNTQYYRFAEVVCMKCIEKHPDNKFAYKLLADTYLEQSRYGEAAETYKEVILMLNDEEVSVSLSLSIAACYVHEMDDLILEDSEKNASQISELQQQINETYFEIFQKEDMDPNLYLDAAISYAYYLCFHCMYENCYSFLCAVEEEYFGKVDAAYKINLAFGHLHGFETDDNPHFNLDFAIKHYRVAFYLAEQILGEIIGVNEILFILMSLAEAYYKNKQYGEAILICQRMLYYKPDSEMAKELILRIKKEK